MVKKEVKKKVEKDVEIIEVEKKVPTKEIKKIKEAYSQAGNERKLKLALLVFSAKGWDSIEKEVKELHFAKLHAQEMRNELNQLLGVNLECGNC